MTKEWENDPEKDAKEQKEIVAEVLKVVPQFPPDTRQEGFYAFVDEMRKRGDLEDPEVISMSGFHASKVDMGWLRDAFEELVEKLYVPHGPYYLMPIFDGILEKSIQRLKTRTMHYDGGIDAIMVLFISVDDAGSYEYRMSIPTPPEAEEEQEA